MGIVIDEDLSWSFHVNHVYKKLIRFVGLFYKARYKLPLPILRTLYFTLIYPHLLYGIEIYGNASASCLDPLVKLNNKILRILQGKNRYSHIRNLYTEYETLPISLLFQFQILKFVYKSHHTPEFLPAIYNNYFIPNSVIHQHNTRSKKDLHRFPVRSLIGAKQIKSKGAVLWNDLSFDLKNSFPFSEFKKKLKINLLQL